MNLAQQIKLFIDTFVDVKNVQPSRIFYDGKMYAGGPGSGRHHEFNEPKNAIQWKAQWFATRGEAPIKPLKELVKQKPLAEETHQGFTTKIVRGVDEQTNTVDGYGMRSGVFFITNDKTGKTAFGDYWMDWPETSKLSDSLKYAKMDIKDRARQELNEQKKWGFKQNFEDHYSIKEHRIEAGGVGSGCKGHHCGRPRKKDEGKQSRAKASYNPSNRAKQIQAENNEKALAKALDGASHIGDNAAFDVIVSKARVAFEVKTIIAGKRDAITMHPSSRERKEKAWKDMKLKNVFTVIFDDRHGKIYYGEGVKNFRIKSRKGEPNPSVKEISNLKQLRKLL